ncbi:MAG: FAD-dependent oxidoreductase, partial [Janthinobacterium lividum]
MTNTDVAVIGLGAIGSATLYQLALQGVKAIGIDRFNPPHDHGSTHGETRITRLSVAEGPAYVPLARRSHEIWRELEAQSGHSLFDQVGLLVIG